jgi:transposase
MFSYVSLESRVPQDHPLRAIRRMVDAALTELSPRFDRMYSEVGRPSIAPEKLLRALLLQMLYTIRSERMLMEQLAYNLLFRWFVGLDIDEEVWNHAVFSKNRERLLEADIATELFRKVVLQAKQNHLLSDEHFTVDGTLVEAWAGQKSFQPRKKKDTAAPPEDAGNPEVNFRGQKRRNDTHQSTSDPEARLYRKSSGTEAKLSYLGHVMMENGNGLVINTRLTPAHGRAEREAAAGMARELPGRTRRVTLGGDKNYDTAEFVAQLRELQVTPHLAQNTWETERSHRRSNVDQRTARHAGYQVSQRKRKRVEEIFGWLKTIALMRKVRHRGLRRVGWMFTLAAAAYNLVRMRTLLGGAA